MTDTRAKIWPLKGTQVEEATSYSVSAELGGLTDRDQEILKFEREWWKYSGSKENAIRELFDMSATRYYQILNALIDTEAALDFDPMLVKRLRRIRLDRQRQRSARRLGISLPQTYLGQNEYYLLDVRRTVGRKFARPADVVDVSARIMLGTTWQE